MPPTTPLTKGEHVFFCGTAHDPSTTEIGRSADRAHWKPDSPLRTLWVVLSLVIAVVIAMAGWPLARPKAVAVHVVMAREVAHAGGERTVLNASGYVTARREATVSSKVTGKVVEVLIEEGTNVKEGQVLARLDDTNARASLLLAQAQLASAKAALAETRVRLTEAQQELQRQIELTKGNVATKADFDHAEAAALAYQARLEQQRRMSSVAARTVEIWQQQLDDTVIRAPFAGIATSKNAQPGEMISPMSAGGFTRTGICTVVDMELAGDRNRCQRELHQPGRAGAGGRRDAGCLSRLEDSVSRHRDHSDGGSREIDRASVRVGFDKLDPRILPEMSVKVAFRGTGEESPAGRIVVVPKAAIQQRDGRDVVFVVLDGRVERRAVTVTATTAGESEIGAGLAAGERVVVDGPERTG